MGPIVPKPGTPGFDEFVRRSRDPKSLEAAMMKKVVDDSAAQTQQQVRNMLQQMIALVPGQLFRDIELFHKKFELAPTENPGHQLPDDLLKFRIMFMLEELKEYCDAVGLRFVTNTNVPLDTGTVPTTKAFDAEQAFDALIDLVYVALGTAYMHRFPFNDGWARVQAANMAKVRASGADDERSKRKHSADIVKPEGWKPPVLFDLLDEECDECEGRGRVELEMLDAPTGESQFAKCGACDGKGRRRRNAPVKENTCE